MSEKIKNITVIIMMSVLVLGFSTSAIIKKDDDRSLSERRSLKSFPEATLTSFQSGTFMKEFEEYSLDQFPLRESFRSLKALISASVFHQRDYHGIYMSEGYLSKMEYPMKESSIEKAAAVFQKIYERYLKDTDVNVYFSIIPDKNYYLAEKSNTLAMDYPLFIEKMRDKTDFMTYIDITGLLTLEDYYKTDPHWKQEEIVDVAEKLASAMGTDLSAVYETVTLPSPFYGVYSVQSAFMSEPEQIRYLSNPLFEECRVFDYQNNREISIYDMEKAAGRDPYDMYLSGSLSLITIENPKAGTDKELILFRDSFSSSLAPLFTEGYAKITLADIRYIQSDALAEMLDFHQQDVLFLYSTLVLNNSETLK